MLKKSLLLLVVAAFVATAIGVASEARVQKVMVIKINSTDYIGQPGFTFPEPGFYQANYSGKIIEVAEPAANVMVGKGDLLVSDVYGEDDPLPQKGDNVTVAQIIEIDADGNITPLTDPVVLP